MKKHIRQVLAALLSLVMVFGLSACGGEKAPEASAPAAAQATSAPLDEALEGKEPYVIGSYMPLTGNNSTWAFILQRGQDLAIEEVNANGGFNGHPVKIVRYDTTSSNEEAAKIAVRLVENDKVDACLPSPMSNEIKASANTLNDAHIPTIVVGTSATLLSDANWDYVWRTALNTDFTMSAWETAFPKMGIKSVAIIYSQEDVCVSVTNAMQDLCQKMGIEVVDVESVDGTDTDFTAPLANIVSAKPDVVCCYVINSANTTNQLRQLGYDGLIIQRELTGGTDYEIAGENANGWAFPSLYVTYTDINDCDIPYMRSFLERYQAAYGELPNYEWTYRGYDTIMTLWAASKIAGSNDKEAINEALGKVVCDGLGGTIDLTHSHEGYEQFGSFVYDGNKFNEFNAWLAAGGFETYKQN